MSHEIRTPMNAILGLIHLALKETPPGHQHERLGEGPGFRAAPAPASSTTSSTSPRSRPGACRWSGRLHAFPRLRQRRDTDCRSACRKKACSLIREIDPALLAHCVATAAHQAGTDQLRWQRTQSSPSTVTSPARPPARYRRRCAAAALRGCGYRHRHAAPDVCDRLFQAFEQADTDDAPMAAPASGWPSVATWPD